MKLALRRTAASDAKWFQRFFAWLTKVRLVSVYCHGGIVIGDTLYQANAKHGLHTSEYNPDHWDLFELGSERVIQTLNLFRFLKGSKYDYLGVLGFGIPGIRGNNRKLYCFEWCAMAMGIPHENWMTPEKLLLGVVEQLCQDKD